MQSNGVEVVLESAEGYGRMEAFVVGRGYRARRGIYQFVMKFVVCMFVL
jgi:hypothetical protein